jgi:hypothetical protein
VIAGAVSANSVQAAPMALAKSVTAIAMAKGAAASGTTLILVKAAAKTAPWLKATTLAVILTNAFLSQEIVATHYDFAGNPDGWMTRSNSTLAWLLFGIGFPLFFIVIGYMARFLLPHASNMPHRDYWLAPEQKNETLDYVFHHFLRQACLAAIFVLTLQLLDIQANHRTPPHLSTPLILGAGGCFIAATAVLLGIMVRHFKRVPAIPDANRSRKTRG